MTCQLLEKRQGYAAGVDKPMVNPQVPFWLKKAMERGGMGGRGDQA